MNQMSSNKKKGNKSKFIRQGSTSSINSNSFYSSVLGSDNSHNSQVTNSSSSAAQVVLTSNGELIRCTSYDPISIGGSSRRSSDASCSDIATNRRTSSTSSQAKHLTETNNLVIQPQSIALSTDCYSSSVSSIGSSVSHSRNARTVPPPPPSLNENTSASHHPNDSVTLEECDSDQPIETMNNIILPDDMVCPFFQMIVENELTLCL